MESEKTRDELAVGRSAVRGTTLLVGRTVALQGVTGLATIALVRLLTPRDYGAFALAQAAQYFGRNLVEAGLPIALVRRREPPTIREQRAATGFMVLVGGSIAGVSSVIAFVVLPRIGFTGSFPKLIAVALLSLPFFAFRAVPAVLLERRLRFGRLVVIEVAETVGFYAFALPAAVAGFGAYSLAAAVPVSAAAGALFATFVQRWSVGVNLAVSLLKPLARFGAQASAIWLIQMARELLFVSAIVAFGSQTLAGYYGLSLRIFSFQTAIQYSVQRVGFAALAREQDAKRPRRAAQAAAVISVAVGLPLALTVGSARPLVGVLFGARWAPTADVMIAAGVGVFLITGIGAILQSLALADGNGRLPAYASLAQACAALAAVSALVALLGAWGIGSSVTIGAIAFAAILLWSSPTEARRCAIPVARALAVAGAAAAVGIVASADTDIAGLVLAVGLSFSAWVALSLVANRADLFRLVRLIRSYGFRGRETRSVPDAATIDRS